MSTSCEGGYSRLTVLIKKARVQRIRQEWADQQKAGKLPRGRDLVLPEEEAKFIASRLGIIDGSAKQTK
jgi:hypothetical protein